MGRKKKSPSKTAVLCNMCGNTTITKTNAYVSYSFFAIDGRMPICKSCATDIFLKYWNQLKDERLAIFYTCRKLDIPYIEDIYQSAISTRETYKNNNLDKKDYKPSPLFVYYMSRIYTSSAAPYGSPKVFDDGSQFTDINGKILDKDDLDKNEIEINETKIKELVKKWGSNNTLRVEDYMYLESQYDEMVNSYGEPKDYSAKMYFKDIAQTSLQIKKKRESGHDIDKLIKLRNQLIDGANISPIDPNSAEKTPPIGIVTKMIENTEPIITQDKKYKDIDKFSDLSVQITGQLAKMLGKKGKVVEEYDEYLNEYALDLDKIREDIDGEG